MKDKAVLFTVAAFVAITLWTISLSVLALGIRTPQAVVIGWLGPFVIWYLVHKALQCGRSK